MRLFVLTLAASAFAQPALAHEHARSHHRHQFLHHARYAPRLASGMVYARHRVARRAVPEAAIGEGFGGWQSEHDPDRPGAWGTTERSARFVRRESGHGELDAMIARHAQMNGLPEALVHRVVIRESRYNPRAVNHGALGLMQVKYSTARAMGYTGPPAGLLDPETNLTYAVRYLAGAYRAAGGNANRAVANYARGYYGAAKRAGLSPYAAPTNGWTSSYASAQPVQQVVWSGPPLRRQRAARRAARWD